MSLDSSFTGQCYLCCKNYSKNGILRHLKACQKKSKKDFSDGFDHTFHLIIEGVYIPAYWLHLKAREDMLLQELDELLRATWMECCGHMSVFKIKGDVFLSEKMLEEMEGLGMDIELGDILKPGLEFTYVYDLGNPTDLFVRVVEETTENFPESFQVLARNNPPDISCDYCGDVAALICSECTGSLGCWFCQDCIDEHDCGNDRFLQVKNSPRIGICQYGQV